MLRILKNIFQVEFLYVIIGGLIIHLDPKISLADFSIYTGLGQLSLIYAVGFAVIAAIMTSASNHCGA